MKLDKKLLKKKPFWIICIAVILVAAVSIFLLSAKLRMGNAKGMMSEAQSVTVEKGNISNTVEGSGNLEAAETVGVTAPAGLMIEEVVVESGEKVTAGQTLATLKKASVTSALVEVESSLDSISSKIKKSGLTSLEKEELSEQQAELEAVEGQLTALRENPVIVAAVDGVVGEINVAEGSEIVRGTSSGNVSSSSTSSSGQGNVSQMSYQKTESTVSGSTASQTGQLLFLTANVGSTVATSTVDESRDNSSQLSVIKDYSELIIQEPAAGQIPQKTVAETDTYTGTISWNCQEEVFQAATEYTAEIVLTAKSGYLFSKESLPVLEKAASEFEITDSGNVLNIKAKYEKTAEVQQTPGSQTSNNQTAGNQTSDNQNMDAVGAQASGSSRTTGGNMSGGSLTASYVSGVNTGGSTTSSEYYSNYEAVVFSIEKQDNVKVCVSVDELDILSVEEGQTAKVTLDALEGEEFEGTITSVANSASAGNGSTKYEVEIVIPMNENMRIGMSASASIQVSDASDVLTIPMTALQQRGGNTFVYTEKDSEGNLSGEVMVETGLSDGQSVEIVSGLEEGDTVYYVRTGDSNSSESSFGGVMPGGGQMPGGGEMPGGREMPGGGKMPGDGEMPGGGRSQRN